jgi:F-type H+-transporting ATPase subunit b
MSFDPWTLGFQFLNFAVLLLVLFRLLFKPVREIMARRAAQIQEAFDAAEKARADAAEIRDGLARERERVEQLRAEMLAKLDAEIAEHRRQRLIEAAAEAATLLERGRAVLETEGRRVDEELRERARRSVTQFGAALLAEVADVELHRALLRRLPAALGAAAPTGGGARELAIETAFALSGEEEAALRALLGGGEPVAGPAPVTEPRLLAGVRLRADGRVLDFSLRGQLDALAARLKAVT